MEKIYEKKDKFGVMVGRFSPLHKGHERIINTMINTYSAGNVLIVIGSTNCTLNSRNFFTLEERKSFFKILYPNIRIVGLQDFHNIPKWLHSLDKLLVHNNINPHETKFFGGSYKDVAFFVESGRSVGIADRYEDSWSKVSGTHVRQCLLSGRFKDLDLLLNSRIKDQVMRIFKNRYNQLQRESVVI